MCPQIARTTLTFITTFYLVPTRKTKRDTGEPWTTESDRAKTRSSIGGEQRKAVSGGGAANGGGGRDRSFTGAATAGGGGQGVQGGKSPPPPASGARRTTTAVVVPPSPGSSSVKPDSFDYLTIEVRTEHMEQKKMKRKMKKFGVALIHTSDR